MMLRPLAAIAIAVVVGARLLAQGPVFSNSEISGPAPPERAVTFAYANRPIVELRAQVLSRMPAERAATATRVLDDLVARGVTAPVETRAVGDGVVVVVGGEGVIGLVPADVDVLAGETPDRVARAAASRLQVALADAAELHAPRRLLRGALEAIAVTILLFVLLWLLRRLHRVAASRLTAAAERRIARMWGGQAVRAARVHVALRHVAGAAVGASALVLIYLWIAFVLRCFPYTRPWGESLRSLLLDRAASLAAAILDAMPGLLTVAIIVVFARVATRGVRLLFDAVEQGRLSIYGVYPDTAVPTRRLMTAAVWLFALAMAYPYVPGSDSSGFKGVSVFVGLILSLGSSGVVQHLMSGLMLTFSRAVHVGDFARVGDVEGTVLHIGALAIKVRTRYGEEITVPNAVVVSQMTTNYSAGGGAFLPTSVTIGYDTPWRQVEALLLTAAERTPGIRRTPCPVVWRVALEDYYIKYTLIVAPENPCQRAELLDRLHTRILDAFNEHGVQIMSPHYMGDPAAPKLVPREDWFASPASPARAASAEAPADVALRS